MGPPSHPRSARQPAPPSNVLPPSAETHQVRHGLDVLPVLEPPDGDVPRAGLPLAGELRPLALLDSPVGRALRDHGATWRGEVEISRDEKQITVRVRTGAVYFFLKKGQLLRG